MYRRIRVLWPPMAASRWNRRGQLILLVVACYVAGAVMGVGLALVQGEGSALEAPITPRPERTRPLATQRTDNATRPPRNTPGPLPQVTSVEPLATVAPGSSPAFFTPPPAPTAFPTGGIFPTPPPPPSFIPPSTTPSFPTPPPLPSGTAPPTETGAPGPSPTPNTTPNATPNATPYPGINVLSSTFYVTDANQLNVIGEIKNATGAPIGQVGLIYIAYDASNQELGRGQAGSYLPVLNDGQSSPFAAMPVAVTGDVARVEVLVADVQDASGSAIEGMSVLTATMNHDTANDQLVVSGTLVYNGSGPELNFVVIVAVVMDGQGEHPMRLAEGAADRMTIRPGDISTFTLWAAPDTNDVGEVRYYFYTLQ